jgi:outer membrane protein
VSKHRFSILAAGALAVLISAPAALAADVTDIGFVDQEALSSLPSFASANRQLNEFGSGLQRQFTARAKGAPQDQQQKLQQQFQAQMQQKQQQLFGPLFAKAQVAIAAVASSKNLSVIIDKRIVVAGGVDITQNVRDLLTSPGDPVPPVATPPPSTVGYVDQSAIDNVPKIKAAEQEFATFRTSEDKSASDKMKSVKTESDRDAVLKDYRKALDDEGIKVVKPVLDQTRGAIADIAKKKGLSLVLDRSMIIFGGTDITTDVTGAIK